MATPAATGKVGVCMATSGPGATNLVTGLANSLLDSVPVVAITGQVVQPLIGKDAFQECDITGITLPVTKHNYLVTRIQDIAPTIKEAFYLAQSGRPGPVLVDIPKSLFVPSATYKPAKLKDRRGYQPTTSPNIRQVKLAADAINKATKAALHGRTRHPALRRRRSFRQAGRKDRNSGGVHPARSGYAIQSRSRWRSA